MKSNDLVTSAVGNLDSIEKSAASHEAAIAAFTESVNAAFQSAGLSKAAADHCWQRIGAELEKVAEVKSLPASTILGWLLSSGLLGTTLGGGVGAVGGAVTEAAPNEDRKQHLRKAIRRGMLGGSMVGVGVPLFGLATRAAMAPYNLKTSSQDLSRIPALTVPTDGTPDLRRDVLDATFKSSPPDASWFAGDPDVGPRVENLPLADRGKDLWARLRSDLPVKEKLGLTGTALKNEAVRAAQNTPGGFNTALGMGAMGLIGGGLYNLVNRNARKHWLRNMIVPALLMGAGTPAVYALMNRMQSKPQATPAPSAAPEQE